MFWFLATKLFSREATLRDGREVVVQIGGGPD
jgi:hypothetical protein